jgi:hypothetical protein
MTAARLLDQHWPPHMTVLVLAPHPDDFDAIGVTLHHLHEQQHTLHLAVQQQRNLRTRNIGFDARVLQLNRDAATALELNEAYAEVFELMPFIDGAAQAHSS